MNLISSIDNQVFIPYIPVFNHNIIRRFIQELENFMKSSVMKSLYTGTLSLLLLLGHW